MAQITTLKVGVCYVRPDKENITQMWKTGYQMKLHTIIMLCSSMITQHKHPYLNPPTFKLLFLIQKSFNVYYFFIVCACACACVFVYVQVSVDCSRPDRGVVLSVHPVV